MLRTAFRKKELNMVNFSKVSDNEFQPIPEGSYHCVIEDVKDGTTKDGKSRMWSVRFKILTGDYADKCLFTNLVHNDGGLGNLKKLYSVLGYDVNADVDRQLEVDDILGRQLEVITEHQEYNGKIQNRIPYAGFEAVSSPIKETEDTAESNDDEVIGEDELPF